MVRPGLSCVRAARGLAGSTFLEAHRAGHTKRIEAIDILWKTALATRLRFPPQVYVMDVYLEEEWPRKLADPEMQSEFADLRDSVNELVPNMKEGVPESVRPFVGEYLWSLVFCYRAALCRACYVVIQGEQGKPMYWKKDAHLKTLVSMILGTERTEALYVQPAGAMGKAFFEMDAKLAEEAGKIISGEDATRFGIERAREILQGADHRRIAGDRGPFPILRSAETRGEDGTYRPAGRRSCRSSSSHNWAGSLPTGQSQWGFTGHPFRDRLICPIIARSVDS